MDRRSLIVLAALAAASPAAASAPPSEERKRGGGTSFIQIPTVTATILRSGGRRGVMTVETGLDIADERLRTRATASQPRLRAAFVGILQTYASGLPVGGLPNADYLSRELQRQADMVLGRPGARLLLGTIMIN